MNNANQPECDIIFKCVPTIYKKWVLNITTDQYLFITGYHIKLQDEPNFKCKERTRVEKIGQNSSGQEEAYHIKPDLVKHN